LNGAKRLTLERLERYSLRAGNIRQHRKKHQSQIQTSEILKVDLTRPYFTLYPEPGLSHGEKTDEQGKPW
jgi:hypothetical protein